jgi:hypothetical protein
MEFESNESGLLIPIEQPAPQEQSEPTKYPELEGWTYSRCGKRYFDRGEEWFVKETLESLYIIACAGRCVIVDEETTKRRLELVDKLAVELLGGIPSGFEEFT